jgi:hypothetical protein
VGGGALPSLSAWSSFYVMIGSSAAALTGLMFVVITLVAGGEKRTSASRDGISTFSTPTVAHFCSALLISAILVAPWSSIVVPGIVLGLIGAAGLAYVAVLAIRARRLRAYTPDTEDWVWYMLMPGIAYAAVLGGALALPFAPLKALFAPAGGVVLLVFIGIRNAWDVVTFLAIEGPQVLNRPAAEKPSSEEPSSEKTAAVVSDSASPQS